MKKLFLILSIFLMACCDNKIQQTYFVISKTESISDSLHIFCKYDIEDNQFYIVDTIGKFKIGDTIIFQKRNINNTP
jgi:hypothetical protein